MHTQLADSTAHRVRMDGTPNNRVASKCLSAALLRLGGCVDAVRGSPAGCVADDGQPRLDGHHPVEFWGVVEKVPAAVVGVGREP